MDSVIDFVIDNYIWFAIGAIAILMIIIGFIAEKTDFGRKPFGNKKSEDGTESNDTEVAPIEEVTGNDVAGSDEVIELDTNDDTTDLSFEDQQDVNNEDVVNLPDEDENNNEEDLNVPLGDQEIVETTVDDNVSIPEEEEASEDDVWKF